MLSASVKTTYLEIFQSSENLGKMKATWKYALFLNFGQCESFVEEYQF